MARDAELDRLKVAQDVAFQRKQNAYQAQQTAWEKLSSARDEMNRAYEAKQRAYYTQDQAWQYYQSVKSHNGPRIDSLNPQQERAYHNMVSAFESASSAYYTYDGASARMYADQGHAYKAEAKTVSPNGASLSLKFALLVNSLRLSGQLFKGLKASMIKLGRNSYPPKQSMNVRKLNLTRQRLSLMLVLRHLRQG